MQSRIIIAVAVILVFSATVALADGALAVGDGGRFGVSRNHPNPHRAEHVAMENCGRDCRIVLNFRNVCAALAHSPSGHNGWATGRDEHWARERAIDFCREHGGHHCEVVTVQCDGQ
jgi:hypothetical protein